MAKYTSVLSQLLRYVPRREFLGQSCNANRVRNSGCVLFPAGDSLWLFFMGS